MVNSKLKRKGYIIYGMYQDLGLGCIYRSPSSTTENDYNLWDMLKLITEAKPSHLVIAGDFNIHTLTGTQWNQLNTVNTIAKSLLMQLGIHSYTNM